VIFATLAVCVAACGSSVGPATDGGAMADTASSPPMCQLRTRFAPRDGGLVLPVACTVVSVDGGTDLGAPAGEPGAQCCYSCVVPSGGSVSACICNGTRWVCQTNADCGMGPDWATYVGGAPPETCP